MRGAEHDDNRQVRAILNILNEVYGGEPSFITWDRLDCDDRLEGYRFSGWAYRPGFPPLECGIFVKASVLEETREDFRALSSQIEETIASLNSDLESEYKRILKEEDDG